eukprot:696787-Lingulodinium_polyedra.AAC.1
MPGLSRSGGAECRTSWRSGTASYAVTAAAAQCLCTDATPSRAGGARPDGLARAGLSRGLETGGHGPTAFWSVPPL